jgi:peptide-methionine (R)-S-oxide reductase
MSDEIRKSDAEWKAALSREQYDVLRRKGTERPFSGGYWDCKLDGMYRCAGCGTELFRSDTKFDSGTGWPSFFDVVDPTRIRTEEDNTLGMRRVEVMCATCGGHLGHLFPDGPKPTGLRYCINSAALDLNEKKAGA